MFEQRHRIDKACLNANCCRWYRLTIVKKLSILFKDVSTLLTLTVGILLLTFCTCSVFLGSTSNPNWKWVLLLSWILSLQSAFIALSMDVEWLVTSSSIGINSSYFKGDQTEGNLNSQLRNFFLLHMNQQCYKKNRQKNYKNKMKSHLSFRR